MNAVFHICWYRKCKYNAALIFFWKIATAEAFDYILIMEKLKANSSKIPFIYLNMKISPIFSKIETTATTSDFI